MNKTTLSYFIFSINPLVPTEKEPW